ncbi:hypothetical protein JCM3774_000877 [Rhodotorula dairenensis]
MADELVLNFDAPVPSSVQQGAPRKVHGGRWTDRAKERKRSQIELRRANRPNNTHAQAQAHASTKDTATGKPDADRQHHHQSKAPSHGGGGGGGGGGRGRLEQAVGPAGKKQYISSLFTAEGLPTASNGSSSSSSSIVRAKPSNAPLTAATAAGKTAGKHDGDDDDDNEDAEDDEEASSGPDPAPELTKLGLSREIVAALAGKLGITGPTACQAGAIPRLLPRDDHVAVNDKKGKGKAATKTRKSLPRENGDNDEERRRMFAHDAILRAQTGSGKTLTFLLPMLEDLLHLPASVLASASATTATPRGGPSTSTSTSNSTSTSTDGAPAASIDRSIGTLALILAPTRELATQIHTVLSSVLSALPSSPRFSVSPRTLTAGLLVGGANRTHEKRRLRKGCPIVVATPGRLLDHLKTTEAFRMAGEPVRAAGPSGRPGGGGGGSSGKGANAAPLGPPRGRRGAGSGSASAAAANQLGLRWLIVDECDRLMDLGFEEQMRGILEEVQRRSASSFSTGGEGSSRPPARRTILCSATASEGVDRLAGMAIGQSQDGGGDDTPTPTMPVIGARDDVKVQEPVRRDLTATPSNKRAADDDEGGEAADGEEATAAAESGTVAPVVPSGFTPPSQLLHHYVVVPPKLRFVALVALLRKLLVKPKEPVGKVLVFMSCTDAVDFWWKALGKIKMGRDGEDDDDDEKTPEWEKEDAEGERLVSLHPLLSGVPIYRLHGSLPLKTRLASLNAFSGSYTIEEGKKAGLETDAGVLLCTSVAARGLDVKNVGCVVQVDAPTEGGVTEYVHRVGRTARAGAQGTAYSFVLPNESEYPAYLEQGINSTTTATTTAEKRDKVVKLREVGVEQVLREGYGGAGREYETRATDVQMGFERWVNGSEESASLARKAFQAHVRAYATHPAAEKHLFNLKALHLGHLAKSFGMREAPGHHLASGSGPARKKARVTASTSTAGGHKGAKAVVPEEHSGFEVGRRRKTLDAEARMRKLMRGPQANGGGEFQIAGASELEGLARGR